MLISIYLKASLSVRFRSFSVVESCCLSNWCIIIELVKFVLCFSCLFRRNINFSSNSHYSRRFSMRVSWGYTKLRKTYGIFNWLIRNIYFTGTDTISSSRSTDIIPTQSKSWFYKVSYTCISVLIYKIKYVISMTDNIQMPLIASQTVVK